MNRPVDPSLIRAAAARLMLVADEASVGFPAIGYSWLGAAATAHRTVVDAAERLRRSMVGDVRSAAADLRHLASSAETTRAVIDRWEGRVEEAERSLARAAAVGDESAIEVARSELELVRSRSRTESEAALGLFEREDRATASALDALLRNRLAADFAPLRSGTRALAGADRLGAELDAAFETSREAMRREALGPLSRRIERLERLRLYLRFLGVPAVDFGLLDALREHRERLLAWSVSDRGFLRYDPAGDARMVEVVGDMANARHVAVIVPGITSTEFSFDDQLAAAARHLQGGDPDVAVIAWLGYDAPGAGPLGDIPLTFDALGIERARDGAAELAEFVGWLTARRPDAHLTVVAHSYGSVVAGIAAAEGLAVHDLVLMGSPGVPVPSATAFDLAPGGRVWAGLAPWDPIDELAALVAVGGSDDADGDPLRLIHGINPMHDSFGATEIDFSEAFGHSGYFGDAGLAAILPIVTAATGGVALRRSFASGPPPRSREPARPGTR